MANFDLILLALIAVFIFLRLRSVLGSRDGNEENRNHYDRFNPPEQHDDEEPADNVVAMPHVEKPVTSAPAASVKVVAPTSAVQQGLADIVEADSNFDQQGFVEGAKVAFEMILTAFADDDRAMLKNLLTADVYQNFEQALEARKAAGETLESTLIGITSMEIIEASLQNSVAEVTVRIVSEQVNVTSDAEGAVVDGDSNYIDTITDIWTFMRDVSSGSPNWYLEATQTE